jgi:hypothetical protein
MKFIGMLETRKGCGGWRGREGERKVGESELEQV